MKQSLSIALALAAVVAASSTSRGATMRWVDETGDGLTEAGGYSVGEYRDAGEGGLDWTLSGGGSDGGSGTNTLWLLSTPKSASTSFSTESRAIGFMMGGDDNDGFASFYVDGNSIGTYDMYNRPDTLIVENLSPGQHTIKVEQEGTKRGTSDNDDISIFGGAMMLPRRRSGTG